MSRAINQKDVWDASDALLLEGARPTIERVRQKIGRGSPNTVSPLLDTWFRHLGARIADPGSFAMPAGVPEPVLQIAQHLWERAVSESRADFNERLATGLAAAIANVESEKERAELSSAAVFQANARVLHLQEELAKTTGRLEKERLAHAVTSANLHSANEHIADFAVRLGAGQAEAAQIRDSSQAAVALAQERSDAAQRRAALEIEAERRLRAKAEKRLDVLEQRIDKAESDSRVERQRHEAALFEASARAEQSRADLATVNAELKAALLKLEQYATEAIDGERMVEMARARVASMEELVARLRPQLISPVTKRSSLTAPRRLSSRSPRR